MQNLLLPFRVARAVTTPIPNGANPADKRRRPTYFPGGFASPKNDQNQVRRAVLCPPDLSGRMDCGASCTCGTRPTNSLRFYCEGLEWKFLERGAPAPLSVRLIDTTCTSAKVWYSPSAAQQPALTKPCSSMQNLLRPFRGAPVHFCSGVLRASSVFPRHGCSKTVRQMGYGRYKILCLLVRLHPPRCVVCGREWPLIQKGANGQA